MFWPLDLVYLADPSLVKGRRVIELGAGTGIVGLVTAALGAEVIRTGIAVAVTAFLTIQSHRLRIKFTVGYRLAPILGRITKKCAGKKVGLVSLIIKCQQPGFTCIWIINM